MHKSESLQDGVSVTTTKGECLFMPSQSAPFWLIDKLAQRGAEGSLDIPDI